MKDGFDYIIFRSENFRWSRRGFFHYSFHTFLWFFRGLSTRKKVWSTWEKVQTKRMLNGPLLWLFQLLTPSSILTTKDLKYRCPKLFFTFFHDSFYHDYLWQLVKTNFDFTHFIQIFCQLLLSNKYRV